MIILITLPTQQNIDDFLHGLVVGVTIIASKGGICCFFLEKLLESDQTEKGFFDFFVSFLYYLIIQIVSSK